MTNTRIVHTRGFSMKYKQALKGIENCALAWVEYGVSVRDMTLGERVAAINRQAREREPLPASELPGLVFQRPASDKHSWSERVQVLKQAGQFVSEAIQ